MRIYAEDDDGTRTDITESVKATWDCIVGSMDWGSGFLTIEDTMEIIRVGRFLGVSMVDARKLGGDSMAVFESIAEKDPRVGPRPNDYVEGGKWYGRRRQVCMELYEQHLRQVYDDLNQPDDTPNQRA